MASGVADHGRRSEDSGVSDLTVPSTRLSLPTPSSSRTPEGQLSQQDIPSTIGNTDANPKLTPYQPIMWNPVWLQSLSLLGFVILYLALVLILVLLWHYSGDGFTLVSTNHYYWTFGPTAILVLIVSAWRQVGFYCKALTPWRELLDGNAKAEMSVLLDYVSPMEPISLWRALHNRHFAVVATILGFWILKLITVASTGLFAITLTQSGVSQTTATATSRLYGSKFDWFNSYSDYVRPDLSDPDLVYTTYGVLVQNLANPEGTEKRVAYETFVPFDAQHKNSILSAEMPVFYPSFNCETANITIDADAGSISAASASNVNIIATLPENFINNSWSPSSPSRQLIGWMNPAAVGDQLLVLADIRYIEGAPSESIGLVKKESAVSVKVVEALGLYCQPSYTIENATVTYDFAHDPPTTTVGNPLTSRGGKMANVSDAEFTTWFAEAVAAGPQIFGNIHTADATQDFDVMFQLMSHAGNAEYAALLNRTTMKEAAEAVFENLAVQITNKYFTTADNRPLKAQIIWSENKLQIRQLPLWLMVGGFAVMGALSIYVWWARPINVVSRNPEPIGTVALILRRNQSLLDILQDAVRVSRVVFRKTLESYRFSTGINDAPDGHSHFTVNTTKSDESRTSSIHTSSRIIWWRPLLARWYLLIPTLCLPLAIIATLEVLQHLSGRTIGISTVSNPGDIIMDIYTRFLPASVMVITAAVFSALDFTVSAIAPYHALKSGSAPASRSLLSTLLGRIPPIALWTAGRDHHWGALFSTVAALIGSVLTIIASGLYTVDTVPVSQSIQLLQTDYFDPVWTDSVSNDNLATVFASLTESVHLDYPQFTYGELAFPQVKIAPAISGAKLDSGQRTMTVQLPALKASLECSILPFSAYNITTHPIKYAVDNPDTPPSANVAVNASLPASCLLGGGSGNLSYLNWEYSCAQLGPYLSSLDSAGHCARFVDLHVKSEVSEGEGDYTKQADNPPGCPSIGFMFGYFKVNETLPSNVTTAICYQRLQEIQAVVTFDVPSLTISTSLPPVVDNSTARYLHNGPNKETAFEFRPELNFDNNLHIIGFQNVDPNTPLAEVPPIDNFFQAVLGGRYPVRAANLTGLENRDALLRAVQGFYSRYMAQAISANMRTPLKPPHTTSQPASTDTRSSSTSSAAQTGYTGTLHTPNGLRVRQNNASKLTLQIMLGIMSICGAAAYLLTLRSMRDALPHEPCSIAAVASLLAGSELCSERMQELIPDGAEWMSDKELVRSGLWKEWVFTLGYWDWRWGERRRYGIDVGKPDADE